eukprot:gnl/MRDRNA2_/MRDRNA2_67121_c0_seq1.p1 gnl/MRDRNA2_/MRDRNA2_67121_c0~~gnl/MRDRNA2_/MRDRNA2_67121_c0_seq1.p1  ORF type:complete len:173 (+),score=21.67 gnl/MRDRNA2_/MRDRNA2_67121_c0_seq1:26-520(+)
MKCAVQCMNAGTAVPAQYADVLYEIFMLFGYTVLLQGLLALSYVIQDPFGEDMLDFPIAAFTEYVADCCDSALVSQATFPGGAVADVVRTTPSPDDWADKGTISSIDQAADQVSRQIDKDFGRIESSLERLRAQVYNADKRRATYARNALLLAGCRQPDQQSVH